MEPIEMKQNDIFLSAIINPTADTNTLRLNGINSENTGLMTPDFYKENEKVQQMFTDENGVFNEKLFADTYKKAADQYQELVSDSLLGNVNNYLKYNENSIYRPIEAETKDNELEVEKIINPYHNTKSLNAIYGTGSSDLSIRELAQQSAIWDSEKGEWMDKTANELGLLGAVAMPSLVYAKWDEDGTHQDLVSGQMVKHHKGQYKTNEFGEFYTETLGNRESIGKEFVAVSDVLTKEGSLFNKVDFFDSDGIDKSVGGIIAKRAIQMVPYVIPGVGTYVGLANAAAKITAKMPTLIKMTQGVILGDAAADTNLYKAMNRWENYFKKYEESFSDKGRDSAWGLEQMSNQIVDIAVQFRQMQGLSKLAQDGYLKFAKGTDLNKAMRMSQDAFAKKYHASFMEKVGGKMLAEGKSPEQVAKAFGALYNDSMMKTKEYAALMEKMSKWGTRASMGFMAIESSSDVFNRAIEGGYDRRFAGLAAWSAMLAQYGIMMKEDQISQWFLDKTGHGALGGNNNVVNVWQVIKQEAKAIEDTTAKIAVAAGKQEKTKLFADLGNKISKKWQSFVHGDIINMGGENIFKNALREATQEVTEEMVNDATLGMYDFISYAGLAGERNKDGSFGVAKSFQSGEWLERYALNAFGGFMGGGLFAIQQHKIDPWFMKTFRGIDQENDVSLISAVRAGKYDELMKAADEYGKMDNEVVNVPVRFDTQGNTALTTATSSTITRGQLVANALKAQIQYTKDILTDHNWNMTDDQAFDLAIRDTALEQIFKEQDVHKLVISDLDYHIDKYLNYKSEWDSRHPEGQTEENKSTETTVEPDEATNEATSSTDPSRINDALLKRKMEEERQIINDIYTGKSAEKYSSLGMAYLTPSIRNLISFSSFNRWLEAKYPGKSTQELEEEYGLTKEKLQKEHQQYLEDNNQTSLRQFIDAATVILPQNRKWISPVAREYRESNSAKVRADEFANLFDLKSMMLSEYINEEGSFQNGISPEATDAFFTMWNDLQEQLKSSGQKGIQLRELLKRDSESLENVVKKSLVSSGLEALLRDNNFTQAFSAASGTSFDFDNFIKQTAERVNQVLETLPSDLTDSQTFKRLVAENISGTLINMINENVGYDNSTQLAKLGDVYAQLKRVFPSLKSPEEQMQSKILLLEEVKPSMQSNVDTINDRLNNNSAKDFINNNFFVTENGKVGRGLGYTKLQNLLKDPSVLNEWDNIVNDTVFEYDDMINSLKFKDTVFADADLKSKIKEFFTKINDALAETESSLNEAYNTYKNTPTTTAEQVEKIVESSINDELMNAISDEAVDIRSTVFTAFLNDSNRTEFNSDTIIRFKEDLYQILNTATTNFNDPLLTKDQRKELHDTLLEEFGTKQNFYLRGVIHALEKKWGLAANAVINAMDWNSKFQPMLEALQKVNRETVIENSLFKRLRELNRMYGGSLTSFLDTLENNLATLNEYKDLNTLNLNEESRTQLNDLLYDIDQFVAAVDSLEDKGAPTLENPVSFRWQESLHGYNQDLDTIDHETAKTLMKEMTMLRERIRSLAHISDRNVDFKLVENEAIRQNWNKKLLESITKNLDKISLKGKSVIPSDDDKYKNAKTDEQRVFLIAHNINKIFNELSETEQTEAIQTLVDQLFVPGEYNIAKLGLRSSAMDKTDTPLTKSDLFQFMMASCAEDINNVISRLKTNLLENPENNSVPFVTQLYATRYISAFVHKPSIYQIATDKIKEKFEIHSYKNLHELCNLMFLDGVTGAGKTSQAIFNALERDTKIKVLAAAPNEQQVSNLSRSLSRGNNEVTSNTFRKWLVSILQPDYGKNLMNDLTATSADNYTILETKNHPSQQSTVGTWLKSVSAIAFAPVNVDELSDVIVIDEATHLTAPEQQILNAYVEHIKVHHNKNIAIVLAGDSKQNGDSLGVRVYNSVEDKYVTVFAPSFVDAFKFTTPALDISIRTSAQGKRTNLQQMIDFLKVYNENQDETNEEKDLAFDNYMKTRTLIFNYFETDNYLSGDKIISTNTSNEQLAKEYKRVLIANKRRNSQYGTSDKVMVIAQLEGNKPKSSELVTILADAGFTADDYFLLSPESHDPLAMQGSEAPFVIVHDTSTTFDGNSAGLQMKELYTLTSRSLYGTVIRTNEPEIKFRLLNHKQDREIIEGIPGQARIEKIKKQLLEEWEYVLEDTTNDTKPDEVTASATPTSTTSPAAPSLGTSSTGSTTSSTTSTGSTSTGSTGTGSTSTGGTGSTTSTGSTTTTTTVAPGVGHGAVTSSSSSTSRTTSSGSYSIATEPGDPISNTSSVNPNYAPENNNISAYSNADSSKSEPFTYLTGLNNHLGDINTNFVQVYPGLNIPNVESKIGQQGSREYEALSGNMLSHHNGIGLNGIGVPGAKLPFSVVKGLNLLRSLILTSEHQDEIIDRLKGNPDDAKFICAYFRYLDPRIFFAVNPSTNQEEQIDIYKDTSRAVDQLCAVIRDNGVFSNMTLMYAVTQNSKKLDYIGNSPETIPDCKEQIVVRLKVDGPGITFDHLIPLAVSANISSLNEQLMAQPNVTQSRKDNFGVTLEQDGHFIKAAQAQRKRFDIHNNRKKVSNVTLFDTGVSAYGALTHNNTTGPNKLRFSGNNGAGNQTIGDLLNNGFKLANTKEYPILFMSSEQMTYKVEGETKEVTTFSGLIAYAQYILKARGVTDYTKDGKATKEFNNVVQNLMKSWVTTDGHFKGQGGILVCVQDTTQKNPNAITPLILMPPKYDAHSVVSYVHKYNTKNKEDDITNERFVQNATSFADGYSQARIITTALLNQRINNVTGSDERAYFTIEQNGINVRAKLKTDNAGNFTILPLIKKWLYDLTHDSNNVVIASKGKISDVELIQNLYNELEKGEKSTIQTFEQLKQYLMGANSIYPKPLYGQAFITFCKKLVNTQTDKNKKTGKITISGWYLNDPNLNVVQGADIFSINPNDVYLTGDKIPVYGKVPVDYFDMGNNHKLNPNLNYYIKADDGSLTSIQKAAVHTVMHLNESKDSAFGLYRFHMCYATHVSAPSLNLDISNGSKLQQYHENFISETSTLTFVQDFAPNKTYTPSDEYKSILSPTLKGVLEPPEDYNELDAKMNGGFPKFSNCQYVVLNAAEQEWWNKNVSARPQETTQSSKYSDVMSGYFIKPDGTAIEVTNKDKSAFQNAVNASGEKAHYFAIEYMSKGKKRTIPQRFKYGDLVECYGDQNKRYRVIGYGGKINGVAHLRLVEESTTNNRQSFRETHDFIQKQSKKEIIRVPEDAITNKLQSYVFSIKDVAYDSAHSIKKSIMLRNVGRYYSEYGTIPIPPEQRRILEYEDVVPNMDKEIVSSDGKKTTLREIYKSMGIAITDPINTALIDSSNPYFSPERGVYIAIPFTGNNLHTNNADASKRFKWNEAMICHTVKGLQDTMNSWKKTQENNKKAGKEYNYGMIVVRINPEYFSRFSYPGTESNANGKFYLGNYAKENGVKPYFHFNDLYNNMYGNRDAVSVSEFSKDFAKTAEWQSMVSLQLNSSIDFTSQDVRENWFIRSIEHSITENYIKKDKVFQYEKGSNIARTVIFEATKELKAETNGIIDDEKVMAQYEALTKHEPAYVYDSLELIPSYMSLGRRASYVIYKNPINNKYEIYVTPHFLQESDRKEVLEKNGIKPVDRDVLEKFFKERLEGKHLIYFSKENLKSGKQIVPRKKEESSTGVSWYVVPNSVKTVKDKQGKEIVTFDVTRYYNDSVDQTFTSTTSLEELYYSIDTPAISVVTNEEWQSINRGLSNKTLDDSQNNTEEQPAPISPEVTTGSETTAQPTAMQNNILEKIKNDPNFNTEHLQLLNIIDKIFTNNKVTNEIANEFENYFKAWADLKDEREITFDPRTNVFNGNYEEAFEEEKEFVQWLNDASLNGSNDLKNLLSKEIKRSMCK